MTKQEVLQGALALNGSDKKYTVTVENNTIIIEMKYYGSPKRNATFRYIAHLNDDNTYTESCFDNDRWSVRYGMFGKTKKSVKFTLGGKNDKSKIAKDDFNSEDIKKILRDYLEKCGYKRTKKGFFKRLFGA